MVVRVHPVGDLAVAEVRRLDGRGGPDALGRLARGGRRTVPREEWAAFQRDLQAAGFWTQPTQDGSAWDRDAAEGARWVFEGFRDGRLQVVDRYSPDDPALVALGLRMLRMAGVEVDEREVY